MDTSYSQSNIALMKELTPRLEEFKRAAYENNRHKELHIRWDPVFLLIHFHDTEGNMTTPVLKSTETNISVFMEDITPELLEEVKGML